MNSSSRRLRVALLASLILGSVTAALRPTQAGLIAPCVGEVGMRDGAPFEFTTPDPALRDAILGFRRLDPAATFGIFNCQVDSFSTAPKPTVPAYALPVLRDLGLDPTPKTQHLLQPVTRADKPAQNLDADLSRKTPLAAETDTLGGPDTDLMHRIDDLGVVLPTETAALENRTQPAIVLEPRDGRWTAPTEATLALERMAAKRVLGGFLSQHDNVFRVGRAAIDAGLPSLVQTAYTAGRYARRAIFDQVVDGEPVIDGRLVLLLDANWNVVAVSRMIATAAKLDITTPVLVGRAQAESSARATAAEATGTSPAQWRVDRARTGLDPVRALRVWAVEMTIPGRLGFDRTAIINAQTGQVLSIGDNVMGYTDAKVRRWAYTNGDRDLAFQVVSTGQYTRDDNTLLHDFFSMVTDERNGGGSQGAITYQCTEPASAKSMTRPFAFGTTDGSIQAVRHTHRSDRDFSLWTPSDSSGSFSETHAYYWSRHYYNWMRTALDELGVLGPDVSTWRRSMIVANACIDDVGIAGGSELATQHNQDETLRKVWLGERCKVTNALCGPTDYDDSGGNFVTCKSNGCHAHPTVIHHEHEHVVLKSFFDVGSGLDCGAGKQLKFLHEGTFGSAIPHAFWNFWYGVGYNPATDRLFTADAVRGRVHADDATKLTVGGYLCSNNLEGQGPYEAGRVAGQPLWEIAHGKHVVGNTIGSMLRPATDTDFLVLAHWAVDLVAGSTYKDRYEMANRVMQVITQHGSFSGNAQKEELQADWCDTWSHHSLATFIDPAYC